MQINPIQPLKEDGLKEWWMSYQPIAFKIGNFFGTKEELKLFCDECKKVGLLPISDVVINHMGASLEDNLTPHQKVDPELRNRLDFWKPKERVQDWKNRYEVVNRCMDLPGLNVYNPMLQDKIVDFLNELIDCGIEGFRFDAAKSIGLPSEGYNFWPELIYRLKKYGLFLYGEVIFEENQRVLDEYAKYMHVLGNYDTSDRSQMVKYIETHDTYLSDGELGYTKRMSDREILDIYKSLVSQYENTLFYIRPWNDTWKSEEIKQVHTLFKKR